MKKNRKQILILIILLALAGFIASCDPVKRQARRCAGCVLTSDRKDSTNVQYKDRPVPYSVPGPTIYFEAPNPCAELCDSLGNLKPGFKKEIKSKGGRATVYTEDNKLKVKCEADSLKGEITARDKTISRLIQISEQVPARCEQRHTTDWEVFLITCGKMWLITFALAAIGAVVWWKMKS